MDIEKVFRMKGGDGDTSYSKNSSLQRRAADKFKHITMEAIEDTFIAKQPKSIGIADLGCSSGPNALSNIKLLVNAVEKASRNMTQPPPEFRIYLNDLPTNDFNTVFQALPNLYRELKKGRNHDSGPPLYIAGYPGSFYGRLFPDACLHFIYSSNSLHWLSRVPHGIYDEQGSSVNKKSIYISERSPSQVKEAYVKQFQEDFSLFLKSRSEELVNGGRMMLILLARSGPQHADRSNSFFWEILYQSLSTLVAQGEVEEEKLDSYDVHFYSPSKQELEDEIRKEGSFKLELVETLETDKDSGTYPSYGTAVARTVRSIQESMIAHHFGFGGRVLDNLFDHYATLLDQELAKTDFSSVTALLLLAKL